jgi:hypothetical protein
VETRFHGENPRGRDRAAKAGSGNRAPGRGLGRGAQARGERSPWALPLPRGRRSVTRGDPSEEPVALLWLPGGRRTDRLGDEAKGRLLPARGRVAARRGGHARGRPGEENERTRAAAAGVPGRGRAAAPEPGDRLLPRDAEGEPRGARVLEGARNRSPRGDRALPFGLRQPHARAAPAREEPPRGGAHARAAHAPGALARLGSRALQRLASDPGDG